MKKKISRDGYEKLKKELQELRIQMANKLKDAGEAAGLSSDWHDNPAYEQAQEDTRRLQYQIYQQVQSMRNLEIVEEFHKQLDEQIEVGDTVTIAIEGNMEKYRIAGVLESSPSDGVIASDSPLAEALLDARVGDRISVSAPGGIYQAEVIAIQK